MNPAINWFIFSAFVLLPIISADREPADITINATEKVRASMPIIRNAVLKHKLEPMNLPTISNEYGQNEGEILETGLLFGGRMIDIHGNWTVDYYSKEQVFYVFGSFITNLVANFSYTDKSNKNMQECQLDVEIKEAQIEVTGWYNPIAKQIQNPKIKVYRIEETLMYIDQCQSDYIRTKLSKSLEDNYKAKILEAAEKRGEQLIIEAAAKEDVINYYHCFLDELKSQ